MNYREPKVRDEMKNVLSFWLKKGASGFRIDAINHLYEIESLNDEPLSGTTKDKNSYGYLNHIYTKDLDEMYDMVYDFRAHVDKFAKDNNLETVLLMTEAYTNTTEYPRYFHKRGDESVKGSQMPFNFVLIDSISEYSSAAEIKKLIDERLQAKPKDAHLNWVVGNHDQPRLGSRLDESRTDDFLTMVMTLPGIGVTYNVSEQIQMKFDFFILILTNFNLKFAGRRNRNVGQS